MTRFSTLNEYERVEVALHAFLVWTLELKEPPPHSLLAALKRLGFEDDR